MSLKFYGPEIKQKVSASSVKGLNIGAERVRSVAVAQTPIDQGYLRASLTVIPATVLEPRAAIVSNLAYAVRQHEELSYHHRDGKAKFLESAVNDEAGNVAKIVAQAVKDGL